MSVRNEKLLVGPRVRRLRRTLGLTQSQMAEDLGISASYVNLIEGNQRPISAKLLLKLADVYDFDISDLSNATDVRTVAELHTLLKDPVLKSRGISKSEVEDVINASPEVGRAFVRLYSKYRALSMQAHLEDSSRAEREGVEMLEESERSVEAVASFFYDRKNYFPALDESAEFLAEEMKLWRGDSYIALTTRLQERHGIRARVVPHDLMPDNLRFFDPHHGSLNLSELMPVAGRAFQIAVHLALLEQEDLIEAEVRAGGFEDADTARLARVSLANYFAAALIMPYRRFLKACEETHYDVELLSHRFGTSYEQSAHRLTTLQRPEARGIPFFFVRIDIAGNITKRFSSGRFHFAKFGGTCPLWTIHNCFETPGQVRTQILRMPDETSYFSFARTVTRSDGTFDRPATKLAVGLGCDIAYASRLIYARRLDLSQVQPTPVGTNCYLCERQHCSSRAHAPINRKLVFNERARGASIFQFETE